jgi:hypothetical protein
MDSWIIEQIYNNEVWCPSRYISDNTDVISTVEPRYYDTAGIREMYHYIQIIAITSIN